MPAHTLHKPISLAILIAILSLLLPASRLPATAQQPPTASEQSLPLMEALRLPATSASARASALINTSTVTTTAIAASVAEFSSVQGQDNWYYGYYDGPFTSSNFKEMTYDPKGCWFTEPETYWTIVCDSWGHPSGTITSEGRTPVEQWAVRRWVSEVAGQIRISGILAKADTSGGDGVTGHILIDGIEVWSQFIAGTNGIGVYYALIGTVNLGSVVDFALSPGNNDWNDSTTFTAMIQAESFELDFGQ